MGACNYIVLCFKFGYTILNCVYQRYEIYKYQTKTYLYVTQYASGIRRGRTREEAVLVEGTQCPQPTANSEAYITPVEEVN